MTGNPYFVLSPTYKTKWLIFFQFYHSLCHKSWKTSFQEKNLALKEISHILSKTYPKLIQKRLKFTIPLTFLFKLPSHTQHIQNQSPKMYKEKYSTILPPHQFCIHLKIPLAQLPISRWLFRWHKMWICNLIGEYSDWRLILKLKNFINLTFVLVLSCFFILFCSNFRTNALLICRNECMNDTHKRRDLSQAINQVKRLLRFDYNVLANIFFDGISKKWHLHYCLKIKIFKKFSFN